MGIWFNIYGCQSCPRMTICVVNQPKNDSYCQGLYLHMQYIHIIEALILCFQLMIIMLSNCMIVCLCAGMAAPLMLASALQLHDGLGPGALRFVSRQKHNVLNCTYILTYLIHNQFSGGQRLLLHSPNDQVWNLLGIALQLERRSCLRGKSVQLILWDSQSNL